ncbi:pentatricopeptide repeat-containing protein At5g19020, mitochondrial [Salvia hispanica]|uniref:pentatricopeptide repeat-containing protein At5g19020, mitochondrial n=1 Tax=Salvia hispanica TaxID=49212 RepID=UPI00200929EE|nr:pentatricopeptide repeat-containing protein At5g19020, mitochondrial [Salvia hispanica]
MALGTASLQSLQTILKNSATSFEFALVSALKSISSSPSLISHGQQLHCLVLKSGLNFNVFIQNSLISMYSKTGMFSCARSIFESSPKLDYVSFNIILSGYVKNGRLGDAHKLFEKMPLRNCVSYTTMIMGFAQNECYEDAIALFREMRLLGVVPGEVTMASVLSAYARADGTRMNAMLLHGLVAKLGLDMRVIVSTNLVLLYSVSSSLHDARKIFDNMADKNVVSWNVMLNGYVKGGLVDLARDLFEEIPGKDVVSWGTMIDGYLQTGRLREALALYCEMRHTGSRPNEVMVVDIVSACGQATRLLEGRQFHALAVKMGITCYDFMQATLIHFYVACHQVELAYLQFEEGTKDHVACWNALIAGLMRNGIVNEAAHLFSIMPQRDVFSWSSMISGYAQNGKHSLAIDVFHEMVGKGFKPNEITMVSVFSAISGLSTLKEGRWAHEFIHCNSIPINDNLSTAIIDMYAKCGSIDSALEVFDQIRDKARKVCPWNAIICGLAMHGKAEASLMIFADLQSRKIKPNLITFIGVLSACCHAGLVEAGKSHFRSMTATYGLEPNIKHYGCMVDLLGRAGRLNEAEELVQNMPMEADAIIWGTLLAACKMYENTDVGERAAQNLAKVEPSHGPSRVLLSNLYADAGRWDDAFLVRRAMQKENLARSPAAGPWHQLHQLPAERARALPHSTTSRPTHLHPRLLLLLPLLVSLSPCPHISSAISPLIRSLS